MKISILIIAHNEEAYIAECLQSIEKQTVKPDEVVVICHNCTDTTVSIVQSFANVRVVEYDGPAGVPYARIKGFQEVAGDIVACLDGDSVASSEWFQAITKPLMANENVSLVAGYVVLTNGWFARLTSLWQFVVIKKIFAIKLNYFAWGSNFACRKSDYEKVGGLEPLIKLRETLHLHFWAEDFYLSQALMQIGKMRLVLRAKTYTEIPYWKIDLRTAPLEQWQHDNRALLKYFKTPRRF